MAPCYIIVLCSSIMFLLIYLIFFSISNRIDTKNVTLANLPTIEELFPLLKNDQLEKIAAQFNQNPNWEEGNMPINLTEEEETKAYEPPVHELRAGPGLVKHGHLFKTDDMHPYRIDPHGVHPQSEHHIFVTRHGLYLYTEDEPSAHLLRYGKYQARMAGHKINKRIHEIIRHSGPLTRPIRLISSTQTRAYETLYNIRLQLSNKLPFENEIIQDSGLTECTEPETQRMRWLYFSREYLQPIKSSQRENTITIIASHGNLLTSFDYIIQQFIDTRHPPESFPKLRLPSSTGLTHAETLLYHSIGAQPIYLRNKFIMDEIPKTVNHAQLRSDIYYEWAAVHQCRSNHGHDEMKNILRSGILDHVFSQGHFANRIKNFETILYLETVHEYNTHILPMIMQTCRNYLFRLSTTRTNTDFGTFTRLNPPIPIPQTTEEQQSVLNISYHRFNAYSMPFPVDNSIQKFRKDPKLVRQYVPYGSVHPDSRLNVDTGDEKTSYLTRLGINQIRGVISHIHSAIHSYKKELPNDGYMYPIQVISDPTLAAAETAFHVRDLLINVEYNVEEQITDLGLQYNYFKKRVANDFLQYQRVQILYMLDRYLSPDQNNAAHPTLRVVILCGDGRLFTAFRQQMSINNLLLRPHPVFSTHIDPSYNALKHGHALFFENLGNDVLKLHEELTLLRAHGLQDDQRVPTDGPLQMPAHEFKHWIQNEHGPCTLSYFVQHRDQLAASIVHSITPHEYILARLVKTEWNPYLAGLFIYACRLQLTLGRACETYEQPAATGNRVLGACKEKAAKHGGARGDCL